MAADSPVYKGVSFNVGCKNGLFLDKLDQYHTIDLTNRIENTIIRAMLDAKTQEGYNKAKEVAVKDLIDQFGIFLGVLAKEGFFLLLLKDCPFGDDECKFASLLSHSGYKYLSGGESACGVAWHAQFGVAPHQHVDYVEFETSILQLNMVSFRLPGFDIIEYNETEQRNDEELDDSLSYTDQFHNSMQSITTFLGFKDNPVIVVNHDFNGLSEHGTCSKLFNLQWKIVDDKQRIALSDALDQVYLRAVDNFQSIYKNSLIARMDIDASFSLGCSDYHLYFFEFQLK